MKRIAVVAAIVLSASAAGSAAADTLSSEGRIAAKGADAVGYAAWRISAADGSITEVRSLSAGLTDPAREALGLVPAWIRGDLADLLARLMPMDQTVIAAAIMDLDDPLLLDEVAYAFAYLAPEQYDVSRSYLDLVEENARWVYEMDPRLDYVDLVEVGRAGVDDDWHTTAEYVVMRDGVEETYRLPRRVYYEHVVHPVLDGERFVPVDPVAGLITADGLFWRRYTWLDGDDDSYQRPWYLNDPVRIEEADLATTDFSGSAAGSVLTGPDRSHSSVIRDAASGAPVLLEFVGQGGGCCSNSVPNPNGNVFATTLALERAAAAGDDELLRALLAAGPGNRRIRSNLLASTRTSDTAEMSILVVRDQVPYGLSSDPVEAALVDLDIAPVVVMGSAGFSTLDLVTSAEPFMPTDYVKIVVPSDQPLELYGVLRDRADDLSEYVRRGGTFELHGDSSVDWTDLAMPFGIDAAPFDGSSEVTSLEIGGFPLLEEVMEGASYLWDGDEVVLQGERAFDPAEGAVARVGWWVAQNMPWRVGEMMVHMRTGSPERAVQPSRILYNHYGNCGELHYLFGAALRTVLIPAALVGTSLDDHVWNEFYENDEWHPLQATWSGGNTRIDDWGVAYDADTGSSKAISAMVSHRGDGFLTNVLGRYPVTVDGEGHIDGDYSYHITLAATVLDADGAPVDGATVLVASHHHYDPSGLYVGTWGITGPDGTVDITVGEGDVYYVHVESPLGEIPGPGRFMLWVSSEEAEAGTVFETTFAYDGLEGRPLARMPSLEVTESPLEPPDPGVEHMILDIDVRAGRELGYGQNHLREFTWREPLGEAAVDVMVVDGENYDLLETGGSLEAARTDGAVSEISFELPLDPGGPDLYLVVSSPGRVVNAREVGVEIQTLAASPEPDEDGPEPTDAAADGDPGPGEVSARGGCGCSLVR